MFIAKNGELIIMAKDTKEELEKALWLMNYTSIEESDVNYIYYNGAYITEEEFRQQEKEHIAMLSLTRGDVFRALYLAKQITRDDIRALIKNNELISEAQRELALIDFDEALNFYRGNTLIDTLGLALGITSEQLDKFFETNDYKFLNTEV